MACSRVEPNIHGIHFLTELFTSAGASKPFREKFFRWTSKPSIRTFLCKDFLDFGNGFFSDDFFITIFAVEDRNGHTPSSLTRNTPVSSICYHVINPIFTPGWNPLDIFDFFQSLFSEAIDRCKPLFSSPINNRILTPPAMSITMLNLFMVH